MTREAPFRWRVALNKLSLALMHLDEARQGMVPAVAPSMGGHAPGGSAGTAPGPGGSVGGGGGSGIGLGGGMGPASDGSRRRTASSKWGRFATNICAQSYPRKHSETLFGDHRGGGASAASGGGGGGGGGREAGTATNGLWVYVTETRATMRPFAVKKLLAMVSEYQRAYQAFQEQRLRHQVRERVHACCPRVAG